HCDKVVTLGQSAGREEATRPGVRSAPCGVCLVATLRRQGRAEHLFALGVFHLMPMSTNCGVRTIAVALLISSSTCAVYVFVNNATTTLISMNLSRIDCPLMNTQPPLIE